jgi:DNA-binding NtrC family response regulator
MYKALIVDDDAVVLKTLKMLFEARHFEVSTADSAQAAATALDADVFDLVVTDMRMETNTAGFDVVRHAKQRASSPVVLILSAYPIPPAEWRSEGADGMYQKGGGSLAMIDEIERLLRSQAHQRTAS